MGNTNTQRGRRSTHLRETETRRPRVTHQLPLSKLCQLLGWKRIHEVKWPHLPIQPPEWQRAGRQARWQRRQSGWRSSCTDGKRMRNLPQKNTDCRMWVHGAWGGFMLVVVRAVVGILCEVRRRGYRASSRASKWVTMMTTMIRLRPAVVGEAVVAAVAPMVAAFVRAQAQALN